MPNYLVKNTHVRANGKLHAPGSVVTISTERAAHIVAKGNLELVDEPRTKGGKPPKPNDPPGGDGAGNAGASS
jgi:hypothetical protein